LEETVELRDAIENLYETFASYPLRDDTNACPCCHSASDEQRVHAKPLRKLSQDDLREYAADAIFVWGDANDFKHFLPRIFELTVAYGDGFEDPQVVIGKLYHAEWKCWPDVEQQSVERFLKAAWECVLNAEPHEYCESEIEDWLCGLARAGSHVPPYLATWLEMETDNARLNLAAFLADAGFVNPNLDAHSYWGDRRESFAEVAAWVRSDAVKARMTRIAAEFSQYDFVERAYISLP
jgi:hypothetical protein